MTSFVDRVASGLAVGFGLGLMPRAPGTWGSLLGLPLGAGIFYIADNYFSAGAPLLAHLTPAGWLIVLSLLVVSIWFSKWVIHRTEMAWGTHDDSRIVIDEIIGQAICIAMFRPNLWLYLGAFGLFRLLDISKPGLIGWCDRELPGAWGTLLDDVLAGVIIALLFVGGHEIYLKML